MQRVEHIDPWGIVGPDHRAHMSGDQTLTYGELRRRSNNLAAYLKRTWPRAHAPIAVQGHKEPEMLIAFLAAIKAVHPYVTIDSAIPPQRVERIIATAHAPLTLTPDSMRALEIEFAVNTLSAIHDPLIPFTFFPSGSTGEPKGVIITHQCLNSFVDWMIAEQKFSVRGEIFLNQAPFSFDLSVMDLYPCLVTGGTLFSVRQDDIANPAQLYRAFAQSNVMTWVSTPSFAYTLPRRFYFLAAFQMTPNGKAD